MAEWQDARQIGATAQRSVLSAATNFLGAAASLALVIGIGVWGYKLLLRDVSGVPVVRAVEGPMRVQPGEPGGDLTPHQGLSVNVVAARGSTDAAVDRVVLAPAPLELTVDDALPEPASDADVTTASDRSSGAEARQLAAVERLVDRFFDGMEPLGEDAAPLAGKPAIEPEIAAAIASVDGAAPASPDKAEADVTISTGDTAEGNPGEGGLGRSLRPRLRPVSLRDVQPASAVVPVAIALDVDPDSVPVGTRLAQLGAYESAEVARAEWERLDARFGDYLAGKSRVIQKATSGGRTFYRLRAMGFTDLGDARRFCSAFVAERAECIPVVTR
mgnify:CR=1 FL=1